MSTRTTGKRETLEERMNKEGWMDLSQVAATVRAELQRVARQVRKLEHTVEKLCGNEHCGDKKCNVVYVKRRDVLAVLKDAGR